jgi:hypothetical protein
MYVLKSSGSMQGRSRAAQCDRWSNALVYLFCWKPIHASAPATKTASQLTQDGTLRAPTSTCHPKMMRSRWIIATTRNSVAVTVI